MNAEKKIIWLKLVSISAGTIILDRLTKNLVIHSINYRQSISVLGSFFNIVYVTNPGGAFGTKIGGNYFYITAAFLASIILLLWFFNKQHSQLGLTGIALMFGGAIGNLWDRFTIGKVIDFLDFGIGTTRWPTFNIADSAITIGICLLILQELIHKDTRKSAGNNDDEQMNQTQKHVLID
ncbi:signal peptidase II [bacterium]|nr:signal peptidase II [bacterium]